MTGTHPHADDLLDLHFGQIEEERRGPIAAHLAACPRCREELASVEWVDASLAALPDEEPPVDGLERVLARVDARPRAVAPPVRWLAPLAASMGGVAAGTAAIVVGGSWLTGSPVGPLGEAGVASGFGLAALAFFAIGSFVTLALAPALLMEAQSRRRALAGR